MKNARFVGLIPATLLAAVALHAQPAQALAPYAKALAYSVDFARAMDACAPANSITVVNPGAVGGCAQSNSDTDSNVTGVIKAHLAVRRSSTGPNMFLMGSGFTPPLQRVAVQLTLRTTNTVVSSPAPPSKTYTDQTVICGTTNNNASACGHYFTIGAANGRVSGHLPLSSCVTTEGLPAALSSGNIEIVDAALINCDDGKVIGVPGIRQ